jgi:hypothetical protein
MTSDMEITQVNRKKFTYEQLLELLSKGPRTQQLAPEERVRGLGYQVDRRAHGLSSSHLRRRVHETAGYVATGVWGIVSGLHQRILSVASTSMMSDILSHRTVNRGTNSVEQKGHLTLYWFGSLSHPWSREPRSRLRPHLCRVNFWVISCDSFGVLLRHLALGQEVPKGLDRSISRPGSSRHRSSSDLKAVEETLSLVQWRDSHYLSGGKKVPLQQREGLLLGTRNPTTIDPSGVYIYKSIVNHLGHGNFICKSELVYLLLLQRQPSVNTCLSRNRLNPIHSFAVG